jgi:hypothetical protein
MITNKISWSLGSTPNKSADHRFFSSEFPNRVTDCDRGPFLRNASLFSGFNPRHQCNPRSPVVELRCLRFLLFKQAAGFMSIGAICVALCSICIPQCQSGSDPKSAIECRSVFLRFLLFQRSGSFVSVRAIRVCDLRKYLISPFSPQTL